MSTSLTAKQKAFADEYLKDFNATKAAIRAGFSKKNASSLGYQVLHRTTVQAYLQKSFVKTAAKLEITKERTLQEIGRIAFSDSRKMYHADGSMKHVIEMDDDTAAAIAAVEVEDIILERRIVKGKPKLTKGVRRKARLWDKTKAVEILAKHFQIFEDTGSDMVLNVRIQKNKAVAGNKH